MCRRFVTNIPVVFPLHLGIWLNHGVLDCLVASESCAGESDAVHNQRVQREPVVAVREALYT
jgi:hypothetical protein